jgi:chaperonin GroES
LPFKQKTASGILIPEKAQEALNEGYVVATGKGALDKDGKHIPTQVDVGDKVLLPPYGGSAVKINSEVCIVDQDCLVKSVS